MLRYVKNFVPGNGIMAISKGFFCTTISKDGYLGLWIRMIPLKAIVSIGYIQRFANFIIRYGGDGFLPILSQYL